MIPQNGSLQNIGRVPPPSMLQSLCFEYFAPKVLRTLELRVVVTHAISITCEDPRKVFQTLDVHVIITPLFINTLRDSRQNIDSTGDTSKVFRTKDLGESAHHALRDPSHFFAGIPVPLDGILPNFQRPSPQASQRRSLAPALSVYFAEGNRAKNKTRSAKRR
jgi:hypothetical protein